MNNNFKKNSNEQTEIKSNQKQTSDKSKTNKKEKENPIQEHPEDQNTG